MLVKLTLENFLAHGRTVIELGPGLTVLVGPNNSGKSAVVEGLRCLATNPAPRHFIRHGAKQARVEAEFSDGTRVTWIRKDKSSGYEIRRPGSDTPEEYWKLQGKVPEKVQEVLRLNLVQLESVGRSLDVHLGNQKEPIFLLNEPPSAMAAFFASSTESAHLLAMQKALRHKVRAAQGDERRVRGRLAELARDFPPQVLVLSLGSNDAQDLVDADGTVVARSSDPAAWDAAYKERLAASFDAFEDTGTRVIWVGHVRTQEDRVGTVNRHVHELAAEVAADRDWVQVEDLADYLGSGEGIATTCLIEDGLHLTVDCLDRAAVALEADLPSP